MGTSKILIDGVGIDLTQDTVAANKMLSGIKAHDSNGDSVTGNIQTWQGTQKSGTKQITENGTFDVSEYASAEVNVPQAVPIEVSTDAGMSAVLTAANVGKVYKFTGTTGTYTNGDLYIVEAS